MSRLPILPESHYKFISLSKEDVEEACLKNKTITGIVEKILTTEQTVLVRLGNDLVGYMPFSEVTIYPYTYVKKPNRPIPIQIYSLFNKKIRVKVSDIQNDTIVLSRKANQEEAVEHLKNVPFVLFHILSFTQTAAYGDIGDGIYARLHISEVCKARIRNISEFFKVGDNIWVSILNHDEQNRFNLSYKNTFPPYNPNKFNTGDVYVGTVGDIVNNSHSGFFISITPTVTGIMDYPEFPIFLNYGDNVECRVKRADERGLKLQFLRKL